MYKKACKMLSMALVMVFLLSLLGACGSPASSDGGGAAAGGSSAQQAGGGEALEEYTIQALFPGDTPLGFDKVLAAAEERMKDTLNVKLDFQFIPWSDYGEKVQVKLAAGDTFDLHLNAPWLHMVARVADESIQPMDDYLENCPAIQAAFDPDILDANRFSGKIYGLPLLDIVGSEYKSLIAIRKDLREKYGMEPITSHEEFFEYLRNVKENEPGVTPFTWNGASYSYSRWYWGQGRGFSLLTNLNSRVYAFYEGDEVYPVKPIYEDEGYLEYLDVANSMYNEGLLPKDIMTVQDDVNLFTSGTLAALKSDGEPTKLGTIEPTLQANIPGASLEFAEFEGKDYKIPCDFKAFNYITLNSNSQNPERVMAFLNWIYEDQANYDLLQYGIEGENWEPVGDKEYKYPDGVDQSQNYVFPGYVLLWNVNFARTLESAPEDQKVWTDILTNIDNFERSPLTGFVFDQEPVKNEIAKVSAIWAEAMLPIENGVLPASENLPGAIEQLEAAGYLEIVAEAQRQIDAFLAA